MWIIINVSLTKINIIMQKIEILEEMLIVNGCEHLIVVYIVL